MLPIVLGLIGGYLIVDSQKDKTFADGGLIAPNGKKSNLTPEQYKLVRTAAFKKWFGDWENDPENASKVVDENGEPLVLNHSTRKNQKEDGSYEDYFDVDSWLQERGNYLFSTPNSSVNPIFLSRKGKYALADDIWQIKFFANIKNIFDTDNKNHLKKLQEYTIKTYSKYGDYDEMAEDLYGGGYETFEVDYKIGEKRNKWENSGSIPALISEMGYDAYINNDENVIVVFDRNKLKLADGTNTTFDSSNPDIRYEKGGELKSDYIKRVKEAIKYVENSPKARMDVDFEDEEGTQEAINEGKDSKRIFPAKSKPNSFIVKTIREGVQDKYYSIGIWNEKKKSYDYKYLKNDKYGDKSKEFDTLQIATYDDKGKIVGVIKIATSENKKQDVKKGAFKISVRQDYQNKGIASKLIEKAESEGIDFVEALKNNNFTSKGRWYFLSWLNKKLKNKK